MNLWKNAFTLSLPFHRQAVAAHPYLELARATLGAHQLEARIQDEGSQKTLHVDLDGHPIYTWGDAMPGPAWFDLCQEGGYRPRFHWDRDPMTILFREVLPSMAASWTEFGLPYSGTGFPEGVIHLVALQRAHEAFRFRMLDKSSSQSDAQVAAMFARIPLRAIVLHDRPAQRLEELGSAADEGYLGIDLIFGGSHRAAARLTKVSLSNIRSDRWSPWFPGGHWVNGGREFVSTQGITDFLRASGAERNLVAGFGMAFGSLLKEYAATMNPYVDSYCAMYPKPIPWGSGIPSAASAVAKGPQSNEQARSLDRGGLMASPTNQDANRVARNLARRPDLAQAHILE
jgi:hypothetical protein